MRELLFDYARTTTITIQMTRFTTATGCVDPLPLQPPFNVFDTKVLFKADVIVREFAHFVVVNTDDLCLFIAAKTQTRNEVHDPENNGCHDERIAKSGSRVSKLPSQLDPVAIKPTARNGGYAISASDRGLSEDTRENLERAMSKECIQYLYVTECNRTYVSNYTADGMHGKNIYGIVIVEEEFKLSCKVANSATKHAKCDSSGCKHVIK